MLDIAFVGNCQASALKDAYDAFVLPHVGGTTAYCPDYKTGDAAVSFDAVSRASACVQVMLEPASFQFPPELHPTALRVAVPFVTAGWLWPFRGSAHPLSSSLKYNRLAIVDCSDEFINRRIMSSVDPADISKAYLALQSGSIAGLERRAEILQETQAARDRLTGFQTAAFINDSIRTTQLFSTLFHPTLPLERYLALECFRRLGVSSDLLAKVSHAMRETFYPKLQVPIHPRIADHFGLTYGGWGYEYQWLSSGRVDFAGHIAKYIQWDTDPAIEEGVRLADERSFADAIRLLELGIAQSPTSPIAHLRLIESQLGLGDHKAAFKAGVRALTRVRNDFRVLRVTALSLAGSGNHEMAIPYFEEAVHLHPGSSQTLTDLSFSLFRAGREAEALQTIRLSLAINPKDIHARARLAVIQSGPPRAGS